MLYLPSPPSNVSCARFYGDNPQFNFVGFILYYVISNCLQNRKSDSLGKAGGTGVDDFLTHLAEEYYSDAKQVIVLYDESWEIDEILERLESKTSKSFVTYFLPQDETLGERIKSKGPDHISHRQLPKGNAFIVFVKDEKGFENILKLTSVYPWFNKRAKVVTLIKEKALEPTKGILNLLERENIFNGVVVTEVIGRDNTTTGELNPVVSADGSNTNQNKTTMFELEAVIQIAALDPYVKILKNSYRKVDLRLPIITRGRWKGDRYESRARPIFQEKVENLRGHTLKVCVFEFPPLVIKREISPGKFEYSGLEIKILKELARNLNFTFEFYEPPNGERWGEPPKGNETWTGLIGEVARGNADMGFASIFLLDNREQVVDISVPYDQDRGCFAVPRPEALQHWLGLVMPFSWQVWATFMSMAIVAGPIFSLLTRPLNMDTDMGLGRSCMYAVGSLFSVQKAPEAKSNSLRLFVITWLVYCWLALIIYRVSLIVSLTIGPSDYKVDTISALVRAQLQWGGYKEVLKTFTNTTEVNDQILFERFTPILNVTKALDRVAKEGDFAVLDSGKFLKYAANGIYFDGYSSLIHVTKECPTSYNVGFAFPIGSPFLEKVNQIFRLMQNAGLIEKWLRDILHEAALKNPNRVGGSRKRRGLTIDHLKLAFVVVLCGHFFGFIAFLVETCVEYRDKILALALELNESRRGSKSSDNDNRKVSNPSFVITQAD